MEAILLWGLGGIIAVAVLVVLLVVGILLWDEWRNGPAMRDDAQNPMREDVTLSP